MDTTGQPDADRYIIAHRSAEFVTMSQRWRAFVLRANVVLAVWWITAILLGAFAPGVYRAKIAGEFNVGLLVVLVSFALTLVTTAAYLRFAGRVVDPAGERIRTTLGGKA
jgi:uncharacterized membrane protein (DUF485 family)